MATILSKNWECVIEVVPHIEAQKHINQWRHQYDIQIIECKPINATETYLCVLRRIRE